MVRSRSQESSSKETQIRVPRTHGLPKHTLGSTEILLKSGFMAYRSYPSFQDISPWQSRGRDIHRTLWAVQNPPAPLGAVILPSLRAAAQGRPSGPVPCSPQLPSAGLDPPPTAVFRSAGFARRRLDAGPARRARVIGIGQRPRRCGSSRAPASNARAVLVYFGQRLQRHHAVWVAALGQLRPDLERGRLVSQLPLEQRGVPERAENSRSSGRPILTARRISFQRLFPAVRP